MFWKKKYPPAPVPPPAKKEVPPDVAISEQLSAYQHQFYETQKGRPDPAVDEAKAKIARAHQVIRNSRIGYSLIKLIEHVKYWPSWSERDDFAGSTGFPVSNIVARKKKDDKDQDRTFVQFSYSGAPYTVVFVDEGLDRWGGSSNRYGKVELYAGRDLVCGLDISADTSRGFEYERWDFSQVSAFAPGDWMKHIVEIGAHIDAHSTRQRDQILNTDALERGAKIKF